jgi:hypothetical protein
VRPSDDLPAGAAVVVAAAALAGNADIEDRPKRHIPIVMIMVMCRYVAAVVVAVVIAI